MFADECTVNPETEAKHELVTVVYVESYKKYYQDQSGSRCAIF